MKPRRVKKRYGFPLDGAACTFWVYTDGTAKVRVDHPSNDPAVEGMIAGRIAEHLRRDFEGDGYELNVGPIRWRSDPDGTAPRP